MPVSANITDLENNKETLSSFSFLPEIKNLLTQECRFSGKYPRWKVGEGMNLRFGAMTHWYPAGGSSLLRAQVRGSGQRFLKERGSFLIALWYFVSRVFLLLLLVMIIWLVYLFIFSKNKLSNNCLN